MPTVSSAFFGEPVHPTASLGASAMPAFPCLTAFASSTPLAGLPSCAFSARRGGSSVSWRRRPYVAVAQRPDAKTSAPSRAAPPPPRSAFGRGNPRDVGTGRVTIDRPRPNRREVASDLLIQADIATVWGVLSDYSRLAEYIPNLAMSELRPHPRPGGIRLEQCGVQKILGFEFRAAVVMDMTEVEPEGELSRAIDFVMVDSRDFKVFEGRWGMEAAPDGSAKTLLSYNVAIVPKGLVPVKAIEWRIGEDVPQNMEAVKRECEQRRRTQMAAARRAALRARDQ